MVTTKSGKLQILLALLSLMLSLKLTVCQQNPSDHNKFSKASSLDKQQRYGQNGQVYSINWLWTTPASALPNHVEIKSADNSTDKTVQSDEKIQTYNKNKRKWLEEKAENTRRKQDKIKRQKNRAKQEADIAAIKSNLMREFASEHGQRIRRSRRYANLFDGSGYMLDHMEELRQYESRAREHQQRQRRSTDNKDQDGWQGDFNAGNLPDFSSLTELLDHLNEGPQGDIIQEGINLRFMEQKLNNRLKRSNYLNEQGDINEAEEDSEDDWRSREREAEASIERLDAMLKDLARYLDEEHIDAAEDAKDNSQQASSGTTPLLAGFNKHLAGAHKALDRLRDMLVTATASGRMSSMHAMPHQSANWQVNAETLRDNVQQLRKIYRQMDEL